jgi:hypothetical protein
MLGTEFIVGQYGIPANKSAIFWSIGGLKYWIIVVFGLWKVRK